MFRLPQNETNSKSKNEISSAFAALNFRAGYFGIRIRKNEDANK